MAHDAALVAASLAEAKALVLAEVERVVADRRRHGYAPDDVRELGSALKGYSPNVRLPTITLPTVSARADTSAPAPATGTGSGPRPAEPAEPRPAVVLEAVPGAIAEGAVLVENHLTHPVTAAIHARIDGASDVPVAIAVEPEHVDLAPGEAAVVRVTTTIPHVASGGIELRGELLVPELVGTSVPVLIRGHPKPPEPAFDSSDPAAASSS